MTPEEFVAKWQANRRPERAVYVEHFTDLCRLLDEPTPNEADGTGTDYAFEAGATKTAGGRGWADVWKRGHFAIEYKSKKGDLASAFTQLQRYALSLDNPPLLVVCDIDRFIIRTNWTNTPSETHTIPLEELRDPRRRRLLKWMFSEPEQLRPARTRDQLTNDAASDFVTLARRLRTRGHDAPAVAHFINRIVFCLFADKAGLLPPGLLQKMLARCRRRPERFPDLAAQLFRAMRDPGGMIGYDDIAWFNGGLFDDDMALPVVAQDIADLQTAATRDWSEIDPSIFGTLFERGLDPEKEKQIGAHYTDAHKINLVLEPVLLRPLRAEWDAAKARIGTLMAEREPLLRADREAADAAIAARAGAVGVLPRKDRDGARRAAASRTMRAGALLAEAQAIQDACLKRLRAFRVLDPACGSGNFLYLALMALKDLERLVVVEGEALGLPPQALTIGPEVVLGIELNSFAVELARVSVWIGAIQWALRNGYQVADEPILKPLDTIAHRDALLDSAGQPADWPAADVIVGNPPFVGDKEMNTQLGPDYTTRLRAAYADCMPGAADLVCWWFEKARQAIAAGRTARAGLVATQSIRKGASRRVLDRIRETGRIYDAWDDEPWTVEGAAVRVSLVCFAGADAGLPVVLDGIAVEEIYADLTAGRNDLTLAHRLPANAGVCFQGPVKVGAFDVDGDTARQWLAEPPNANGRTNAEVVRPWINGRAITRRPEDSWIIDFGERAEREASFFARPFAHVVIHVKPKRDENKDRQRRERWWLLGRSGGDLRQALNTLTRFIATPRVAKHRLFVWCPATTLPDSRVYAIARDDDMTFGILHSRFHEAWSLRQASWHGVGNDPTYNNLSCFETFPFPEGLGPDRSATAQAADPRVLAIAGAARALVEARDRWLNPGELVLRVPEVVPGYPDRIVPRDKRAEAVLAKQTLTALYNARGTPEGAWLDALHADLDAAVAAAYGWPVDITEEEALSRLLALNLARSAG